ncbi:MAG: hypothetical protein HOV87_20010 [Catenulispora sp.]|nr:hypothetical protein [Catenulispora sp.]
MSPASAADTARGGRGGGGVVNGSGPADDGFAADRDAVRSGLRRHAKGVA